MKSISGSSLVMVWDSGTVSRSAARTFHQWHQILANALSRREAAWLSVRVTVDVPYAYQT